MCTLLNFLFCLPMPASHTLNRYQGKRAHEPAIISSIAPLYCNIINTSFFNHERNGFLLCIKLLTSD